MTQKKEEIKRPPIWIAIATILSIFVGIFSAIVGIDKFENYFHPYLFGLVSGGIGLILGVFIALRLKPIIAVNQRLKKDYGLAIMYLSIDFIGVSLLAGSLVNQKFSKIKTCDNYSVIDKYRQEGHYRSPEINSLIVNIDGEVHPIVCSYKYWERISVGQSINLCLYQSKLGFDYINLTDE